MTQDILQLARAVMSAGRYPNQHLIKSRVYDPINKNRHIEQIDVEATVASMYITMLRGVESGLQPLQALYNIVWYNDRPCIYGDVALALIQKHPNYLGYNVVTIGEPYTNDWKVTCTMTRQSSLPSKISNFPEEKPEIKIEQSFSWADVKRAGLHGLQHYQEYPERMMTIRARTWAMRDLFSDVLNGLSIAEEQLDVELVRDLKPDPSVKSETNAAANMDEFTMAALQERGEVEKPALDTLAPGAKIDVPEKQESIFRDNKKTPTGIGSDPEIPDVNVDDVLAEAEKRHKKRK